MTTRHTLLKTSAASAPATAPGGNPIDLYVKDWGAGRPIVFAHGWPLSADSWDFHASAMVDAGYRTIAYDRRGFGRSPQPADGYDYDTLADDLARIIDQRDLQDVTLVGFSMGGAEVVRYLTRHGGKRVRKLVLVGATVPFLCKTPDNPAGVDVTVFDGMKDAIRQDRPKFMVAALRDVIYGVGAATNPLSQETLAWSLQVAMQASLRSTLACVDTFANTDLRRDVAAISVSTLLLHGTADVAVPIALARHAAGAIGNARLVEYPGATHGLLVTERDRVAKELLEFAKA